MRGKFMSNEADNKTPREFFRITSGVSLVRYTRRSRMTRQKCSSGARWRTRFSVIYRSAGKMVSPAGESGDLEMQFTLWLTTNRLLPNTRAHAYVHIYSRTTDTRITARLSPDALGSHASSLFASPVFERMYAHTHGDRANGENISYFQSRLLRID